MPPQGIGFLEPEVLGLARSHEEIDGELEALRDELSRTLRRADDLRAEIDRRVAVAPGAPVVAPVTVDQADDDPPLLVPLLSFEKELALRGLILLGTAAMAWFWMWWLGEGHGTWSPPAVIVTSLFAWVSMLTAYFFFFAARMTRPNPAVAPPDLKAAMVVTKAPSEPWPILQRTLEAMLDQDYPYAYDVWLADERPSEETLRWCLDHGVAVSSRFGVEEYHQAAWPRRTKSKEGNLAYFYDCVGYDRYEVVAQLDADHVPARDYLAAIMRPFRDPGVGYVSAPSICDANADAGWTVRGRLYKEATLHGPVQAGSNQGYAPVCIGSHYAVRTAALREVGGIGPELAEDFTTTLWMQSGGWDGVFAIDAEAHGDGPETLAEMLTQEVQWSRSLGIVLGRYAFTKLKTVPLKARIRLGFAILFYPLQGVALLFGATLPALAAVFGWSWGNSSLIGFYGHLWPMSLIGLGTAAFLRRQDVLRPRSAKLWSWEVMLFQLIRWPWAMHGAFQGVVTGLRHRERAFKVTPKGERGLKPLPLSFVIPSLLLGAAPVWVLLSAPIPPRAMGFVILAAGQAVTYLLAISAAVGIHLFANSRPLAVEGVKTRDLLTGLRHDAGGQAVLVTICVAVPTILALILEALV